MKAAELKTQVTQERQFDVLDQFDETARVWRPVDRWWAKLEETSGGERVIGGQKRSIVRARLTCRWRLDVRPTDQLKVGSKVYQVEGAVDLDAGKSRWLVIDATRME